MKARLLKMGSRAFIIAAFNSHLFAALADDARELMTLPAASSVSSMTAPEVSVTRRSVCPVLLTQTPRERAPCERGNNGNARLTS